MNSFEANVNALELVITEMASTVNPEDNSVELNNLIMKALPLLESLKTQNNYYNNFSDQIKADIFENIYALRIATEIIHALDTRKPAITQIMEYLYYAAGQEMKQLSLNDLNEFFSNLDKNLQEDQLIERLEKIAKETSDKFGIDIKVIPLNDVNPFTELMNQIQNEVN